MSTNNVSIIRSNAGKCGIIAAFMTAAAMLLPATSAFASGFGGPGSVTGGFNGPGPALLTVQQALEMRDDARVSVKGNIVGSLGDEAYTFKDATGTIEVDIDNEVWRGQTIAPEDVVVISGEVDKEWNHASIDVSSISKQ